MSSINLRTFDSLPTEVIQQIASAGSCESALALTKVNRNIRHICNDRQVYKAIRADQECPDDPDWSSELLSAEAPLSSWARYTLADSRARRWMAEDGQQSERMRVGFFDWAPQLLAIQRKTFL